MIFNRGFTLVETIVAIYVLLIGIVGAMSLAQQNISAIGISRDRLIATNLAQEGIELIRNKRDTNYIMCLENDFYGDPDECDAAPTDPAFNPNEHNMFDIADMPTSPCDTPLGTPFGCYVEDPSAADLSFLQCPPLGCPNLLIDSNGLYSHRLGGTATKYVRTIVLTKKTSRPTRAGGRDLNDWEIKSRVTWSKGEEDFEVEVKDYITPSKL
jgi:prepilin-type N-terminal cleavage/methylation domain-containing protein